MAGIDAVSWQRVVRFASGPVIVALAIGGYHWLRRGALDTTDLVPILGITLITLVAGLILELRRARQAR